MGVSSTFHEGNRRFQVRFASRPIADKLASFSRAAFSEDDKSFMESAIYCCRATVDGQGRP